MWFLISPSDEHQQQNTRLTFRAMLKTPTGITACPADTRPTSTPPPFSCTPPPAHVSPGLNCRLMSRATCPSVVRSSRPLTMRAATRSRSADSATCSAAQCKKEVGWLDLVPCCARQHGHGQQTAPPAEQGGQGVGHKHACVEILLLCTASLVGRPHHLRCDECEKRVEITLSEDLSPPPPPLIEIPNSHHTHPSPS
jgi:hypothetical protein